MIKVNKGGKMCCGRKPIRRNNRKSKMVRRNKKRINVPKHPLPPKEENKDLQ